jgi:hypothetical protein
MRTQFRMLVTMLVALVAVGFFAVSARAASPSNTSPPTITGTLEQGKTLTAQNGTWSGAPSTFAYRWQRCNAEGTSCGAIDGAIRRAYTLTAADVDHTLRVAVTATNLSGQDTATSAATAVISANTAPKNTSAPTVSGTARVGEELNASNGSWTGGVRSFALQWQRCDVTGENCADVTGATGSTYGVRSADVGNTLRVVVTATNLAGSATAASATTAAVDTGQSAAPPRATNARPRIAILGVRFVGAKLFVRFRACDDSRRNLSILAQQSKRGLGVRVHRFRTITPPRPCTVLTRGWVPAPALRHGRLVVTLRARDITGLQSRPATRALFR